MNNYEQRQRQQQPAAPNVVNVKTVLCHKIADKNAASYQPPLPPLLMGAVSIVIHFTTYTTNSTYAANPIYATNYMYATYSTTVFYQT